MKWRVQDWSLRSKFTALTMFINLLGLSLFSGAYALNEYYTARTDANHELATLGDATAAQALGTLVFEDSDAMAKLVSAFRDDPIVTSVRLYRKDGAVAAEWTRERAKEPTWPGLDAADSGFYGLEMTHMTRVIRLPNGTRVGALCIYSDLMPVKERMWRTLVSLLGLWGICLGVAFFATRYLQGLVVRPVVELSDAMHQATETKDYTQRVPVTSHDEIGRLETGFNNLLGKVQVSQSELEQRVRERTAELGEMNERLIQEVQKRFRIEEALRLSEERLGLAVKGSDLGLWDWNIVTGHVTFSERLLGMISYTVKEVRPHVSSWEELLHPDDKPHVMDEVKKHLEGRTEIYETEHRLKMKNGEWLWILDRGQVVERDTKGNPLRAAGTHLDISLRKETERLLRESHAQLEQRVIERTAEVVSSEERLHLLAQTLESTREMIAISDETNRFIYVNEAFQRGYGYSLKELLGKTAGIISLGLSQGQLEEIPEKTAAGGWQGEVMNRAKDGREFPISLSTSPVFAADGKLIAMVGVATDISERKRLEREVLEAGERERQRIGQDLHDDLCQYLTGIRFKAALLEKKLGANGDKMQDDAGDIVRLLADATELARALARGLQPVEPTPNGLMSALERLAQNTSYTFKISCHCRFPKPVLGHDPHVATQIYRIAQEAVQNAIKHAQPGGIEISLEAHGNQLILTVSNDGLGFQPDHHHGIGLQTMRHRAQMIGGVLEIKPLPERGTVVTCSMPHYPSAMER